MREITVIEFGKLISESKIQIEIQVDNEIHVTLMNGIQIKISSEFDVTSHYNLEMKPPRFMLLETLDQIRNKVLDRYPNALCYQTQNTCRIKDNNKTIGESTTEQGAWEDALEIIVDDEELDKEYVLSCCPNAYSIVSGNEFEIRTSRHKLISFGKTEADAWANAAARIKSDNRISWELR